VIWLLRHGDAEDGSPDAQRQLTHKGIAQAKVAGSALAALGVKLDACLTSPRVRAADTAKLACEPLGLQPEVDERLSGGGFDPEELAAGHGDSVLLVGHEPDFSDAIARLTGGRADMKKGGLAGVDSGTLRVLLRPRELRSIAHG
jgi:phosphohistidine phosphatase